MDRDFLSYYTVVIIRLLMYRTLPVEWSIYKTGEIVSNPVEPLTPATPMPEKLKETLAAPRPFIL